MKAEKNLKHKTSLKILLILSLILVSFSVNAEKRKGYYITNDFDTIRCKIYLLENPYQKNISDFKNTYSFHKINRTVSLIADGAVKDFKPQDIAGFAIIMPGVDTCKFVSVPTDKHFFYRQMATGKISMYLKYQSNMRDGGITTECIFVKNNETTKFEMASAKRNKKKKVALLLSDNPEILAKWETVKFDLDTLLAIIKEYNSHYENLK